MERSYGLTVAEDREWAASENGSSLPMTNLCLYGLCSRLPGRSGIAILKLLAKLYASRYRQSVTTSQTLRTLDSTLCFTVF